MSQNLFSQITLQTRNACMYTNHSVGNVMRKHFMTEPVFTENGKGSKFSKAVLQA